MRSNFTFLLKNLPTTEKLKKITKSHLDSLIAGEDVIDAKVIARTTMKIFLEFVLEREWEDRFEILVESR